MVDYRKKDFWDVFTDIDLVFDTMGGDVQTNSFKVLKENGRLISIVSAPDENLAKEKGILAKSIWLQPNGEQLSKLGEYLATSKLRSVIGATFPLNREGIYKAHELSETHHAVGKIVIQGE
ncbi:putative NAD(P)H quinone oxidoreductase, PIG3 family [Listeria fleischmannii subsp. fleischmannii]|uniref:Putative NAD(P)H quinone oxidoreductase, PIG3 family n=1 Tax=Listeria fleischmannii subsp. fleischmannii TaxID=1671902 RepID=A0A2X3HIC4_9LIST|nr:putative NAD(P)H quinone oxidoreductase, PIG3 family [Listeria fleischmannii subsp. fleischmannii]